VEGDWSALAATDGQVRHVQAPNPGPMTFRGTNTYLVGRGTVAVIDPGPDSAAHRAAILSALDPGERIATILVTHAHVDHSAGVPALKAATGAEVLAFGDATAGRSAFMAALAASSGLEGGEGVDAGFAPDRCLADGETVAVGDLRVTALHTPGHMANHLSFALGDVVFTGDLVMGWSTSLVSPPDGDLGDFLRALDRLAARTGDRLYLPGHGDPVSEPAARVAELAAHRRARQAQIEAALAEAPGTAAALAARIYTEVPPALLPAAARNVLAHLLEMLRQNRAACAGPLSAAATFRAL
jgi:hydroxyacylglutathione hydrolase